MGFIEIIIIAFSVSLDAFAVSVCGGAAEAHEAKRVRRKNMLLAGIFFGGFQFIMPLGGFVLGEVCKNFIEKFDHFAAFALLFAVGTKMIVEAFKNDGECEKKSNFFSLKNLLTLAIATSIDALAVGASLALVNAPIFYASLAMGAVTFIVAAAGVVAGSQLKRFSSPKLGAVGGLAIIAIGAKILIEHLM